MAQLPPEILASIAGRRLNIGQQKEQGLQQLGNQYNEGLYNLDTYSKDAQRRINDQYASQGIFDSGIRVNEQGRLQKNVGERRGFLGQQYAQGQQGINSQYQNAMDALMAEEANQMAGATRNDLENQLKQQQINAQNAATMAQQQAAGAGGGGGGGVVAGGANDPAVWYAQALADEQARQLWYNTIYNQSLQQFTNRDQYGNAVKMM